MKNGLRINWQFKKSLFKKQQHLFQGFCVVEPMGTFGILRKVSRHHYEIIVMGSGTNHKLVTMGIVTNHKMLGGSNASFTL